MGATAKPVQARGHRPVNTLVVHCSAEPHGRPTTAATIRQWHLVRGFATIGYHWVIRSNGIVEPGRPMREPGAHVSGHNHDTIGICLVGGLDPVTREPSPAFGQVQLTGLKELLLDLRQLWPNAAIRGHRDFPGVAKACPCFDVREWCHSVAINPR